jgi:hypothetical protein
MELQKFDARTQASLRCYVYALADPDNGKIFYVGKASANNRPFSHLKPFAGESAKKAAIEEIRSRRAGCEPVVHILRHGLKDDEMAEEVEAAIIDTIGLENLTNLCRGKRIERGRATAKDIARRFGSLPLKVSVIKEARKPDADGVLPYPTAIAIVKSTVVMAYEVQAWFPAGSTMSTRPWNGTDSDNRWEFVGRPLPDHWLVGKRLLDDKGKDLPDLQNGYSYIN